MALAVIGICRGLTKMSVMTPTDSKTYSLESFSNAFSLELRLMPERVLEEVLFVVEVY